MIQKTNYSKYIGTAWQRRVLMTSLLSLTIGSSAIWAHSPNDAAVNSLPGKIRQAALITYGKVVDIQYRNSEPTKEQPKGVPHTFVTYEVLDVLRGELGEKTLTLRIPGGADGEGGIYMETTAPVFALGQSDVLFVKGGEVEGCQLVDCAEGRFRVVDNQVFNAWGVPVVDALKTLRIGGKPRFDLNVMEMPRPAFQALLKRPESEMAIEKVMKETGLGLAELEKKYEEEAPKSTIVKLGYQATPIRKDITLETKAKPAQKFTAPLTPELFFEAVRTWSKQMGEPTEKVIIADANARFIVADPVVEEMKSPLAPPIQISEEERLEMSKEGGLQ